MLQYACAFLRGLREWADRHGLVHVLDEVQAGVGRTGKFWPTTGP
nr:aminotransferase class III-fold pyridoxal phosphate-dependent enzyme [Nocardia vinacea]